MWRICTHCLGKGPSSICGATWLSKRPSLPAHGLWRDKQAHRLPGCCLTVLPGPRQCIQWKFYRSYWPSNVMRALASPCPHISWALALEEPSPTRLQFPRPMRPSGLVFARVVTLLTGFFSPFCFFSPVCCAFCLVLPFLESLPSFCKGFPGILVSGGCLVVLRCLWGSHMSLACHVR